MKTTEHIKAVGLRLFNQLGLPAVTLRDIAAEMGKSYGNITYHFPNKEALINVLYQDMSVELQKISAQMAKSESLLQAFLHAPKAVFGLSLQYLFFFKDYVYLIRTYPQLAENVKTANEMRKQSLKGLLLHLQKEGFLQDDLTERDILYLMELSGAMRTFFFLQLTEADLGKASLENEYVEYVNRLLYPYLSAKGKAFWAEYALQ